MHRLAARLERLERRTMTGQRHVIMCGCYDPKRDAFPDDGREEIARRISAGEASPHDEFQRMVCVFVSPRPLLPDGSSHDMTEPLRTPTADWDGEKWVYGERLEYATA